jgi:amino acid adenylation domain-containing protein/non-ribosomal peptide synthase protein (TIGR01720 family)
MSPKGAFLCRDLDPSLAGPVRELCRSLALTPFMLMLATFKTLLYRYTGQPDLLIGTPVANRHHGWTEAIVGFFVNTLVLRTQPSGKMPFSAFCKTVRTAVLDAFAHQDLPFDAVVDLVNPERDPACSPLFQVMFTFEPLASGQVCLPGVTVREVVPDDAAIRAKFDLVLGIEESENGYCTKWGYCTDLFLRESIALMAEQFEVLLSSALRMPDSALADLPMQSASESVQLARWNDTAMPLPPDQNVADLFEKQAACTPDNPALVFGTTVWTYRETNERANELACVLQAQGVGRDMLVGVPAVRSAEMVMGALAVLKAGAAYLPLDPAMPVERARFMLEDAGVSCVLTMEQLRSGKRRDANPQRPGAAVSDLAYMIYTSGSTGQPKGVLIEQRGLINTVVAFNRNYAVTPDDRILQQASLTFDVSAGEIFPVLCAGGALVITEPEDLLDAERFKTLLQRERVTIFGATPSLLAQWCLDPAGLPDLRLVFCGGEAFVPESVAGLLGRVEVVNGYGPTETTIGATACRLHAAPPSNRLVPIGRPLPNYTAHILDEAGRPQPIGIPGELCIGGIGVARGYHRRPELTGSSFITLAGQRVYRTGDRARWASDGQLVFMGRLDRQVKLRGFRIELGEIESALRRHPGVNEAAVVLRRRDDRPFLAAYVTLTKTVTLDEVRSWLHGKLPEHMTPASMTVLDRLPLTRHGKLDEKALPEPALPAPTLRSGAVEKPGTPTEQLLTQIWQAVLKLDHIGLDDNFFHVGGDSLLSMQVAARAREAGLSLRPRDLIRHQTIRSLAGIVRPMVTATLEEASVRPHGAVPLTPIQRAFFKAHPEQAHHYNQSLLLMAQQPIDSTALHQAVQAVAGHHDALRLRFSRDGSQWYAEDAGPVFSELDLSTLDTAAFQTSLAATLETVQRSFDLAHGPLMRVVWIRHAAHDRLFICLHHLVVDGVSWRILMEDLQRAYHQCRLGQPVSLPPAAATFQRWAGFVQTLHVDQVCWQTLKPGCVLPLDNPEGSKRASDATWLHTNLSREQTNLLLRNTQGIDIREALLAALLLALRDLSDGGNEWLLNLESHGRPDDLEHAPDVSRTVGWFTAVYAVLFKLPHGAGITECLSAVKTHLAAVPHGGIGYGILHHLHGKPLPQGQILFNYLGQFDHILQEGLFRPADEGVGPEVNLNGDCPHELEISARVAGHQLEVNFGFPSARLAPTSAQRLATRLEQHLAAIAQQISNTPIQGAVLLRSAAEGAKTLFMAPGSGGRPDYLRPLAMRLTKDLQVIGLNTPGLLKGETIPETIEQVATHHVQVIRAVQPHGPYHIAGHSFGACTASEAARILEDQGESVAWVAVLDQPTPTHVVLDSNLAARSPMVWLLELTALLESMTGTTLPIPKTLLQEAGLTSAAHALWEWLTSLQAQDLLGEGCSGPDGILTLMEIYRANALSYGRYQQPQQPLRCPIELFRAAETLRQIGSAVPDDWGWRNATSGPVQIHDLPGDHLSLIRDPAAGQITKALESLFDGK